MWQLIKNDEKSELVNPQAPHFKPFSLDFSGAAWQLRKKQVQSELLLKAIGRGKLRVLDATIGLGRDAFVLASFGHSVTGIEKSPILFELIKEALPFEIIEGDAQHLIPTLPAFDVIYLDPMFPVRQKSALVKKEAQILQDLGYHASHEEPALLATACRYAKLRVVVKRPLKAAFLAGQKPHHQIVGKIIRFDVYNALEAQP